MSARAYAPMNMIKRFVALGLMAAFSMPASAQTQAWPYYPPSTMEWRYPGEHNRWYERREERERHEERWRHHDEWCRYHPRECR
jgi:hypothetical protein